ncbi:hypothetical protein [Fodinisporobacter ferrooxydans]|uniref:hypothetical protein n=1 Tax=Fodinisporobacter ferrooxydans TaxID=2901836 RepID=UPI003D323FFF
MFRRIGVTIEYPGFYPNLTAKENLLYNARMMGVKEKRMDEWSLLMPTFVIFLIASIVITKKRDIH